MKRQRQITAKNVAAWVRRCVQEPQLQAYDVVRSILVQSLSEQQRAVLAWVEDYGDITSADVAMQFNTSVPNASTVLKQLYEFFLIDRDERTTTRGREYVYSGRFTA
jgi:predicted transcriptional regulator